MDHPKLFISYSWSNPEHEQWVLALATELQESGVEVILDKWDLKEGHDALAFMEKMVNDPDIKKVAIICDQKYAEKANDRSGGVGTETQIISREVYEQQEQDKFVAVVVEKDEKGKAYLPTYYKSRIYIDLSEADTYTENFEKLLRWIYDKPLYVKPELGNKPSFLSVEKGISLGTAASYKKASDAVKNGKSYASGALDEYLFIFTNNLERFRISGGENDFDEKIIKSIEEFLPFRNEAIQIFVTISQYNPSEENIQKLHRFFESLIPYMDRPEYITHYQTWDFDNYKFLIHELFLYAIAILLKYELFEQASYLMKHQYYIPGNSKYGRDVMVHFCEFRRYVESFEHRNKRLKLKRLSLRADLLKDRSQGTGIDFRYLMQADFVLFLRAELDTEKNNNYSGWWPETLLYIGHYHSPFEIFARAQSKTYFEKIKCLLNIDKPSDLSSLFEAYSQDKRNIPRWEFDSFNPAILIGLDSLAKKP